MDIKTAAQWIRDNIETQTILDLYGYHTKHGFMLCPFHGDKDASLKVYPGTKGWHCFGCGRGGSVIDFVMEHENCNFKTAIIAIEKALHLSLMNDREFPEDARVEQRLQEWLDDFVSYVYGVLDDKEQVILEELRHDLTRMKRCETLRLMAPPVLKAEDYDFMNQWKEISQYNEYRLDKISELREEVAAWRRKWRKAKSA